MNMKSRFAAAFAAFAATALILPAASRAEQKTMNVSDYKVAYDDARWFAGREGGAPVLKCKPKICTSLEGIIFYPRRAFGNIDYGKLAAEGGNKAWLAKFLASYRFGGKVSADATSVRVSGNSAVLTAKFTLKDGTYRYPATMNMYFNGDEMYAVIGVSRSSAKSSSLASMGNKMIRK